MVACSVSVLTSWLGELMQCGKCVGARVCGVLSWLSLPTLYHRMLLLGCFGDVAEPDAHRNLVYITRRSGHYG